MKKFLSITAVGCCSLSTAQAGSFKWNRKQVQDLGWAPAHETPAAGYHQPLTAVEPVPTSPPELRKKDATSSGETSYTHDPSVCGYFGGASDAPFNCNTDEACVFTVMDGYSVGGCCPTTNTDCHIQTTCADYTVYTSATDASPTSSLDDFTWWCADPTYPYCATLTYGDLVSGYSNLACATRSLSGFQLIDYDPISTATDDDDDDDDDDDVTSTQPISIVKVTVTTTPVPGPTTTTATPTPNTTPSHIGAIVGGVIGGVAVIALLILGLIFLLRKKKTGDNQPPNPDPHMSYVSAVSAGGAGAPQGPSPTSDYQYQQIHQASPIQQQQYPSTSGFSNDVQKPSYNVQAHQVTPMYDPKGPTPPPNFESAPAYQPPATTQHQHQHQQVPEIHEMPSTRGDGTLTELA